MTREKNENVQMSIYDTFWNVGVTSWCEFENLVFLIFLCVCEFKSGVLVNLLANGNIFSLEFLKW